MNGGDVSKEARVFSWIVLVSVFCCLVFWWFFSGSGSIPDEPSDQISESADAHEYWNSGDDSDRSREWPRVRNEFLRIHPRCEACGDTKLLNVHHIVPFHVAPKMELDKLNLITLCREHHFRVGHDPDGPWGPKQPDWKKANPKVREHARMIRRSMR
jgi:hypothetical protein